MKFKVKVIKSKKSSYWYNRHIGEIFEVEDHDGEDYILFRRHDNDYYDDEITAHYIFKEDCLLIGVSNTYGDSKLKHYFV